MGTADPARHRALAAAQTLHADVAPLVAGIPAPDGAFNTGDLTVILRIALGELGLLKPAWPGNQFNIGDSIGEGEAAYNDIGNANHETVWSTGYDAGDSVASLNERIEAVVSAYYYENTAGGRDAVFNRALSGAVMAGFAAQAQGVVMAAAQTPTADAGMVTVLLGNNDVCASSMANMTAPALFEAQYRAGLDVLAASEATRNARIHVSGIPAIYWLWNARFSNFWCRVFAWPFVPCETCSTTPATTACTRYPGRTRTPSTRETERIASAARIFTASYAMTTTTTSCVTCWRNTGCPEHCPTLPTPMCMMCVSMPGT